MSQERAVEVEREDRKQNFESESGEVEGNAVVASLAKVARPSESGQGDGATLAGGKKRT